MQRIKADFRGSRQKSYSPPGQKIWYFSLALVFIGFTALMSNHIRPGQSMTIFFTCMVFISGVCAAFIFAIHHQWAGFLAQIVRTNDLELNEQEEEIRFARALAHTSPVGICLAKDNTICFANTTLADLTGYRVKEIKGRTLALFYPDKSSFEQLQHDLESDIPDSGLVQASAQWVRKDGSLLNCSLRRCPLDSRHNEYLWVVADVSERVRLEKERANLEKQLITAQRMESLGVLASGIAHDFNNILSPILGYSQLLLMDVTDKKHQKYISGIFAAAQRSRELIGQILAFSRQKEEKCRPVLVHPLVMEIVKLLTETLPSNIIISSTVDRKCGPVLADPTQIHQVIMNLCTNAYQAMKADGGNLNIQLETMEIRREKTMEMDLPGSYVVLKISDTGPGMTKKIREHMFDPYFTTKTSGRGTGLGLSVVHSIVKRVGGFIRTKSSPGQGSIIEVFLPRAGERPPELNLWSDKKQKIYKTNCSILLVDDEQEIVDMITEMLIRHIGCEVTSETCSLRALKTFKKNPGLFDLIITDRTMPHLVGTDLAILMKKIRPDIPVILCAGFSERPDQELNDSPGIDGFLMKPIALEGLGKAIHNVLNDNDKEA